MAGLMAAPMVILELVVMHAMYPDRRSNLIFGASSVALLALLWLLIRQQAGVTERQFLRSMIPHHGGAILMCRQAAIRDAEIKELCKGIVSGQQSEIERMKGILKRLSEPAASSKQ